ncbi:MAG TPA: glycosyltransferase family 39 protein [Myxococcales bacterium]|nr:glycosyltransferase family 39 protein [Myxococcales bacterium]
MQESPEQLRGRTAPWGTGAWLALAALTAFGLWLRLRGLSAEGFGDDEVHKWLAANRYLHGVFSGDDVEHPMLMKWLIAGSIAIGSRLGWAPETMTRLPNALAGGASVVVVALLARRLFGRTAGLLSAALAACSVTLVGYQRVAKEDTLLGIFLMLLLWCMAEAKAAADDGRDPRRWELGGAASLAGMLASKYFFFLTPVPVVFYLWVRRDTQWRVPLRRWLQLVGVAALLWVCVSWSPFLPSTWEYAKSYTTGQQTVHGSLLFMGRIYHNLLEYGVRGTPPWFYAVFAAVKLAPLTFLCALAGLAVAVAQRRPAHKLMLSWLLVWFVVHSASGSKWGRFFVSVLPAFLILAGQTGAMLIGLLKKPAPRWAAIAAAVLLLPGAEAFAAVEHAPHYRLYISPLGGGDARVQWYFPHCDYFDAGFREAVQYVAAHAEPDAELSTEIDWPAKLYAEKAGRQDLQQTLVRRGRTCRSGHVCYVVVQTGRLYFLNRDAVANLSRRTPWHVESIGGREVVRVYRLLPGEMPFPDEQMAGSGPLVRDQ